MRFCVVVPMYNESGNVEIAARELSKELDKQGLNAEILMVDDGSSDNTLEEIKAIQKVYPRVIYEAHGVNKGFGAARSTAMRVACEKGYDFALFFDADLTTHPRYIINFYEMMQKGYDFVTGSRYTQDGCMENVPLFRVVVSRTGSLIAKVCFRLPISDYTQPFRAIKASLMKKIHLKENGFAVSIEEVVEAKKFAYKMGEIPIVLTNREIGASKFIYTPRVFYEYLRYAIKAIFVRRGAMLGQKKERYAK